MDGWVSLLTIYYVLKTLHVKPIDRSYIDGDRTISNQ